MTIRNMTGSREVRIISDMFDGFRAYLVQFSRTGIEDEIEEDCITARSFKTERGAERWARKALAA